MLPGVKITLGNGVVGGVAPNEDKITGFIFSALAVSGGFAMGNVYALYKYEDLATKTLITPDNNYVVDKVVSDFYAVAGTGTELWVQFHATSNTSEDLANKLNDFLLKSGYRPKNVGIYHNFQSGYTPTITDGLDAKIWLAQTAAQTRAVDSTTNKFAPVRVLIQGIHHSWTTDDTALRTLTSGTSNRVGIVIGFRKDTTATWGALGLVLGKIAATRVSTHIGRVKDGKLPVDQLYLNPSVLLENDTVSPATISDKGYISFRTFVGKAGYFITDDKLATGVLDDYRFLTRARTIDKAYRLAYQRIVEEVNETVPINANGTIKAGYAKALQENIASFVAINMVGDVSTDDTDPNDKGIVCFIDPVQNIVTTEELNVVVKARPFGYSKYINVLLSFTISK